MKNIDFKMDGMTIAVQNMDAMLAFYQAVFGVAFEEKEMYSSRLYAGKWGGLNVLFCPAEIARNTAKQNRHQFDLVVSDLDRMIELATANGGKLLGEVQEKGSIRSVGVYDPDNNSMVFKEINKR